MSIRDWLRLGRNGGSAECVPTPQVEPLEPRLLLNVDLSGVQPLLTCNFSSPEQAVYVDLDQQDASTQADLSPVLTIAVVPCDEANQPVSTERTRPDVGSAVIAESAGSDSSALRPDEADSPIVPDQQDIGVAADTSSVGIRGPPDLPGMHVIDPDISNWLGQVIYLDFDGEQDVTYHGPVIVGPFDVPTFQAPRVLAGHEQAVIAEVLAQLEQTFANSGTIFTTEKPSGSHPYSTIYVGGDDSIFAQYGSFLGLAEEVDVRNLNRGGDGWVFSDEIARTGSGEFSGHVLETIAHEVGHLLGYEHTHQSRAITPLSQLAKEVGGEIGGQSTWDTTDSPYQVTADLHVQGQLTIDPDVIVQIAPGVGIYVNSGGQLAASEVTFERLDEAEAWHGLCSSSTHTDPPGLRLTDCTVRGATFGVELACGLARLEDCTLTGNEWPFRHMGGAFDVRGSLATAGNTHDAVNAGGGMTENATWTSQLGLPYEVSSPLVVSYYATLSIRSGVVVRVATDCWGNGITLGGFSGPSWWTPGCLDAVGVTFEPVNSGEMWDGLGINAEPADLGWSFLHLTDCTVRGAMTGVRVRGGNALLEGCWIYDNAFGLIVESEPPGDDSDDSVHWFTVNNCDIYDNSEYNLVVLCFDSATTTWTIDVGHNWWGARTDWEVWQTFFCPPSPTTLYYLPFLTAPHVDPGDSLSKAQDLGTLPSGQSVSRPAQIGDGPYGLKDVDLFEFTLASAGTVTLDVDARNQGSPLDTYLRLFDASGQEIGTNEDSAGSPDSRVSVMLPAGTYYAGVSGSPNRCYSQHIGGQGIAGSTGFYTLTVTFSQGELPPPSGSHTIGGIRVEASGFTQNEATGDWTAEGTILLNGLLQVVGTLQFNEATQEVWGNAKVWLNSVPVLGSVLIYDGAFRFPAGQVATGALNDALSSLKVAGLDVYVKSFSILTNGVRLKGSLKLPEELGGVLVDFGWGDHYIDVTSSGLVYDFVASADKTELDFKKIKLKASHAELAVSNTDGTAYAVLTGTFSGTILGTKFNVNLSKEDGNYFAFGEDGWDLVGSLDIGKIVFGPGLYADDLHLDVDTTAGNYYGEGKLTLPFGHGVTVDGQFRIINGYLDSVGLTVPDLDVVLWDVPPVLMDKIGGTVEHITPDAVDHTPIVIALNAGLQLGPDLGDYNLLYLDVTGELDLAGKITGTASLKVGDPDDPMAAGTVTASWQWKPIEVFTLDGSLYVGNKGNPLVSLAGNLVVDGHQIHGALLGTISTDPLPDWLVDGVEFLGIDVPASFSAGAYFQVVDDNDSSNDYVIVGSKDLLTIKIDLVDDFSLWHNVHLASYEDLEPYLPTASALPDMALANDVGPLRDEASVPTNYQIPMGLDAIIFRADWETGDTDLRLTGPDGQIYTAENYAGYPDVTYLKYPEEREAFFVVRTPQAGLWQVAFTTVDDIGVQTIQAMKKTTAPAITLLEPHADQSGGPVNITWTDADSDSDASISLYYDTDRDRAGAVLVASGISEDDAANSYIWDTSGVPTGDYYICAVIDDGSNLPAISYSTGRVTVIDPNAPTRVTGLSAPEGTDTSARLVWEASTASDLDYYIVRLTSDAAGESYERVVTAWEPTVVVGELSPGEAYRMTVAAVDTDGHVSADSEPIIVVVGGASTVRPEMGQWEVSAQRGSMYEAQVSGSPGDAFSLIAAPVDATLSTEGVFQWAVAAETNGWQEVLVHVTNPTGEVQVRRYNLLVDGTAPELGAGELQIEALSDIALQVIVPDGRDDCGVLWYQFERDGSVAGAWQISPAFEDSGLTPNASHTYRVQIRDSSPGGWTSPWSTTASGCTWAAVPGAVVFGETTQTTILLVQLGPDGNPAATEYALYNATAGVYVAADGSPSPEPVWQMRDAWSSTVISGLSEDTEYRFAAHARNGAGIEAAAGPTATTWTDREAVPPTVDSTQYDNLLRRVDLVFSEPVVITVKDLTLTDASDQPIPLSEEDFSHAPGSQVVAVVLDGIEKGSYTLTTSGNSVIDLSSNLLDGDGDGMEGEDFSFSFEVLGRQPTAITLSPSTVAENEPSGTTVGVLSTVDPDPEGVFTYTLVGADIAAFSIEGDALKTAASFDFEAQNTYNVRVCSTDSDGLSVEETLTIQVTDVNEPPNAPDGTAPEDGATGVGLFPTLESSDFSDPDAGDAHAAAQWQIDDNGDFGSPVWDYEDTDSDKTGQAVPPGALSPATTYYWRVRHQDRGGAWSDWSAPSFFTTADASSLRIDQLEVLACGFAAYFTRPFDATVLNLYDATTGSYGPADMTVVGQTVGPVNGSLVVGPDGRTVSFVKTGGPLEPDTYTVTIRSAANAFHDAEGRLLDGDADCLDGADYAATVVVAPTTSRLVSVPDVARGPGQAVNIPATGFGLPVQLSDGTDVQAVDFTFCYDPTQLTVGGISLASGLPGDWTLTYDLVIPGQVPVSAAGVTTLPAGRSELLRIQANIPDSTSYRAAAILQLDDLLINDGAIAAQADSAVLAVAYLGDTTGNRYYSGLDASYIARVAVGLGSGFQAFPLIDPAIVGDTTGNGRLSSLDASYVARKAVGLPVPQIPDLAGPTVAIIRQTPSIEMTNAGTVVFDLTFSRAVVNADATDFTLSTTGNISSAVITGVTGSGASWTVNVATGSGDGTLGLDVAPTRDIQDGAGNLLRMVPTQDQVYAIDKTAPSSAITFPASAGLYNAVGWTDAITGTAVDAGDSGLSQVAVSIFRVATSRYWNGTDTFDSVTEVFVAATGTSSWSLVFAGSQLPADGTYTVHTWAMDQAGNAEASPTVTFTYDATAPTLLARTPDGMTITVASADIDVTFSEEVVGVDTSDLVLSGAGAAGATVGVPADQGSGRWRFPVTGLANGPVNVTLAPHADDIADLAGNTLLPVSWSFTVELGIFEDPDLEQAVRTVLQIPLGTPVRPEDMLALTSLSVDSNEIDSLVGLEYAANLQSLTMVPDDYSDLGHLSSLAPLSGLNHLEELVLQRAGLDDAEFATLGSPDAIESIDLRYNQITEVGAVADLPSLSSLLLYGNPIESLAALAGKLVRTDIPAQGVEKATTVAELAEALHDLPIEMYEYVRNTIEFEPYAGSMKGAQAAWETGTGNDWDTASLLAEMLAHAGVATRYVQGRIEIPIDTTMDWLGVKDAQAAADVLVNSDISQVLITDPYGTPVSMEFDHTWLEAELYIPGKGMQWLALDPSWKFRSFQEGVPNLLTSVPFNESGYLSQTRLELTYEYYESQVAAYLATNVPGKSLADVAYDGPILPQEITGIDGVLPYAVLGPTSTYGTIPDTLTHRVGLRLTGGGATHFDLTLAMPDTCRQRITINFADAGGGWLHPELRLDGVLYAGSPYDILSGTGVTLRITHYNADGDSTADRTYDYDRQAGDYIAVGLDAGQISTQLLNEQCHDVNNAALAALNGQAFTPDDRFGAYLALSVWGYYYETRHAEQVICGLTGGRPLYRRVASGLATSESTVQYFADLQFPYRPEALGVDLANTVYQGIAIDGDQTLEPSRRRIVLDNKSAQEHAIWESISQTPTMSTIKSLQLAHEGGIPVHVIDATWSEAAIRTTLQLGTSTESDIVWRVLSLGETVTVPERNTPLQDWNGVGYIAERDTGTEWSAAYMITGGLAGGVQETFEGGYITGDYYYWEAPGLDGTGYDIGDPINIANGNVSHEETDFRIPNIGIDLEFTRQYNSTVKADVGFGAGWTHTYSDFLTFKADGSITWTDSGGMNFTFVPDGLGGYDASVVLHGATFSESGGQYTYRDKHGLRRIFDGAGRLIEMADRNDNSLVLSYDGLSHLVTVADSHLPSRTLTFTWVGAGLMSVSDFTGRTWTYTQDGAGRLASATTPSDAETPAYTARYEYYIDTAREGLLKQVTHPDGGVVSYEYYANGRGFEVTDPEGFSHHVHYNVYRKQTVFTEERGFETVHTYNDSGNLIRTRHPDGAIESWTWADSLKQSWTDAFGNAEAYEYDSLGNLTRLTDRAGVATDYTYDTSYSQLTREERFGGRVTEFDYDANGNLVQIRENPLGMAYVTTMTYDSRGLLLTTTQAKGNLTPAAGDYTTTYTYSDAGQVLTQTTDLPSLVSYGYDARGHRTSITNANTHTTTYDYDLLGRLIGITDPLTKEIEFTCDAMGNMLTLTDKLGRITTFEYDLRQRLLRTIHPDGTTISNVYDPTGNPSILVEELGHATQYEYDALNRLIAVVYADGASERTAYDGGGRTVRTTDARGYQTDYVYDKLGRMRFRIDAQENETEWTYDELGNLRTVIDPRENTTEYRYDVLNRMTEMEGARHKITYYTYDANGNLASVTDPLGRALTYGYDVLDRQVAVTDGLANTTATSYDPAGNVVLTTDPLGHKTEYLYDELNHPEYAVEDPDVLAYTTITTYDAVGNVKSITDPEGNTTTYSYDARDRVIAETNELGLARRFIYDAAGNLVSATDRNGRVRRFAYDERNRQVSEVWLDEAMQPLYTITRSYDEAGNLLQVSDPAATLTYTYDTLGRVLTATTEYAGAFFGGDGPVTYTGTLEPGDWTVSGGGGTGYMDQYTFDAKAGDHHVIDFVSDDFDPYLILIAPSGTQYHDADSGDGTNSQLDMTLDETGTWTAWATSWPDMGTGAYTLVIDDGSEPGLTLEYAYDEAGNVVSVTDGLGGVNQYAYDELNRVRSITQSGTGVTVKRVDFTYDDAGQLDTITRYADLAGTVLVFTSDYTFDPDAAGRLTGLTHANGVATLAAYAWLFDDAGRITQMTSSDGISNFSYDDTDQLTGADHSYQSGEDYSYDANGNRTNAGYATGDNNRLLSDGTYNYAYDDEGNLVTRTEIATGAVRRFEWDHRNRLIAVTDEDVSGTPIQRIEFTYDAFNRRIAKSVDTTPQDGVDAPVTYFVYDGEDVVLEFADSDGASGPNVAQFSMRYFHGPGVDQVLAQENASGNAQWLLADHQGTIRDITGNTGTLLNHISYDTFGRITAQTDPAVTSRYAFTGREYDTELDLYYYRARYYDAATGRLLSEDPLGLRGDDVSCYRYVKNQPTTFTDPSGLRKAGFWDGFWETFTLRNFLIGFGVGVGVTLGIAALEFFSLGAATPFILYGLAAFGLGYAAWDIATSDSPWYTAGQYAGGGLAGGAGAALGGGLTSAALSSLAAKSGATVVYDAAAGRFRDVATGRFVAARNLPWPGNQGFASSSPGTLQPGTVIDRLGSASGRYAGQPGATVGQRGLPPGSDAMAYSQYVVLKPLPAQIGPAARVPAFGAEGGATQYLFDVPISELVNQGYLGIR